MTQIYEMTIFETVTIILLLVLILAIVWMLTEFATLKKDLNDSPILMDPETRRLRLQAYERVTLLAERIGLTNVLSRVSVTGLSARQMQATLANEIKQEYEYNISQQIYLTPEIWKAVKNLKEQNIYIINQVGATLPAQATAMDLNKQIIEFLLNHPDSSMQDLVLEAINHDAKKLM